MPTETPSACSTGFRCSATSGYPKNSGTSSKSGCHMTGKPETQLQAAIVKALRQMGVWVIHTAVSAKHSRGLTGEDGLPDLCLPALSAWMEVKLPGRPLRPAQQAWHERAKKARVRVATVYGVGDAVLLASRWRQADEQHSQPF